VSIYADTAYLVSTPYLTTLVENNVSNKFWKNGVTDGNTLILTPENKSFGVLRIGCESTAVPETFLVYVAEILVYSVELTDEKREIVQDYLMNKWGI
jgi:hypothetical protein